MGRHLPVCNLPDQSPNIVRCQSSLATAVLSNTTRLTWVYPSEGQIALPWPSPAPLWLMALLVGFLAARRGTRGQGLGQRLDIVARPLAAHPGRASPS